MFASSAAADNWCIMAIKKEAAMVSLPVRLLGVGLLVSTTLVVAFLVVALLVSTALVMAFTSVQRHNYIIIKENNYF